MRPTASRGALWGALALAVSVTHPIPAARAATLVHSNDLLGDIEPCGCRTNPLGGMARKANWLRKLPEGNQADALLQLDAGDLLFSSDTLPELLQGQAEIQARYLLKSMAALKHDAVVPGEKDFSLGVAKFDQLRKESKVRFLAANLVRRKGGKPLLESSATFTRKEQGSDKELKIAVIGIVGDDLPWPKELKALPALAAAKREVAAARKRADLVILLTHVGFDKDKELAAKVPGIDIIVGGHTQSFLQQPIRVGKTIIYQSSFRNQYVGALPLHRKFDGQGYQLTGLDAGFDSPADKPGPVDRLVTDFKKDVGAFNLKNDVKLEKITSAAVASSGIKYHTFPKCAECHLKQFDFWRQSRHALALNSLLERQQYQNKECLACHTVGMGDKQGFMTVGQLGEYKKAPVTKKNADGEDIEPLASEEPEIGTFTTDELATYLKKMHDAGNLKEKVRITPLEPEQTLRRSVSSIHKSWTPVQCENCHQPGRDHPFSGAYSKKVEKTTCLNCHTAERAPEWYTAGKPDWTKIDAKRTLVTCPAGDLSEAETETE